MSQFCQKQWNISWKILLDKLMEHLMELQIISKMKFAIGCLSQIYFSLNSSEILKLSTNSDIFNSSIEQFKTQLSHQIFQVIERNQIF